MNVLTVDIETTGLDPKENQILEVYMGLFDPFKSDKIVSFFYCLINHSMMRINKFSFETNQQLMKDSFNGVGSSQDAAILGIKTFISTLPKPLVLAGKNVAGFDRPFLENFLGNKIDAHYRAMDPAILYTTMDDLVLPSLEECMRRAGLDFDYDKQHTARYDAECVARLLHHNLQKEKANEHRTF